MLVLSERSVTSWGVGKVSLVYPAVINRMHGGVRHDITWILQVGIRDHVGTTKMEGRSREAMLAVRVIHVPLISIKWLHRWLNIEEWPGMTAGTFICHGLRGFAGLVHDSKH